MMAVCSGQGQQPSVRRHCLDQPALGDQPAGLPDFELCSKVFVTRYAWPRTVDMVGQVREPRRSDVLAKLSENYLLTQDGC